MAGFNSSGVFVLNYNWTTEAASPPIEIAKLQTEMVEIAGGLSTAICRDGQSTISADIPWNAKKLTGLGDATLATDALNRQAADARFGLPTVKIKTADETVNDSDSLQDDDDIASIAIVTGKYYELEMYLAVSSSTLNDFKFVFVFSETPAEFFALVDSNPSSSPTASFDDTDTFVPACSDTNTIVTARGGFLANAADGGTLKLQWAQGTATAADTIVKKASFLRVTQLT